VKYLYFISSQADVDTPRKMKFVRLEEGVTWNKERWVGSNEICI